MSAPTTVAIVGDSHTGCVSLALAKQTHWVAPEGLHVHVTSLPALMQRQGLSLKNVTVLESPAAPRLHPSIVADIDGGLVPDSRLLVVSMVGGNGHNVMGLIEHAVRFDFVLPDATDLPIEAGAHVIPYGAMRRCLERRLHYERRTLEALRTRYPGPVVHLASPPPPRDDGFVAASLGDFRRLYPVGNVVSAALRYKLWRLHSTIMASLCDTLDIAFVANPPEVCDPEGFLATRACGNATHGNPWYGARLLHHIEALVMAGQDAGRAA